MEDNYTELEELYFQYARPMQQLEKDIKEGENEKIKQEFEKQRQESLIKAKI